MLQNATPLRKTAPWPPNIFHWHVYCIVPATRNASLQILIKSNVPCLPSFLKLLKTYTFSSFFTLCRIPCACHTKQRLNVQKCSETRLSSKCVSRHNAVHFSHISTSKSALNVVCFPTFDFQACFAPLRHALFHLSSPQMAPPPLL